MALVQNGAIQDGHDGFPRPPNRRINISKTIKFTTLVKSFCDDFNLSESSILSNCYQRLRNLTDEERHAIGLVNLATGHYRVFDSDHFTDWLQKEFITKAGSGPIPTGITEEELLKMDATFNLKSVLDQLDGEVVTNSQFVKRQADKMEDPRKEIGFFKEGRVFYVEMKKFSKWYKKNEPKYILEKMKYEP